MPDTHKEFFRRLPWVVEHPDYLFVHAGFDPHGSLEDQLRLLRERDTTAWKPKWLHEDKLGLVGHAHQTDKTVVAGHTIVRDVTTVENKWLIDTGAGYGGVLTALLLPEFRVVQPGDEMIQAEEGRDAEKWLGVRCRVVVGILVEPTLVVGETGFYIQNHTNSTYTLFDSDE